jgi:hypothetical protein
MKLKGSINHVMVYPPGASLRRKSPVQVIRMTRLEWEKNKALFGG